jgi:hypothetical protein
VFPIVYTGIFPAPFPAPRITTYIKVIIQQQPRSHISTTSLLILTFVDDVIGTGTNDVIHASHRTRMESPQNVLRRFCSISVTEQKKNIIEEQNRTSKINN